MQTMYYKTSNFIEHSGNVIDLDELRRRQTAAQWDSLARQPEVEAYLPEEEPISRRSRGNRASALWCSPCPGPSAAGPGGSGGPGCWTPMPVWLSF